MSKTPHPDADKLNICQVDLGEEEPVQIVCGAPNVDEGQHVIVKLKLVVVYLVELKLNVPNYVANALKV